MKTAVASSWSSSWWLPRQEDISSAPSRLRCHPREAQATAAPAGEAKTPDEKKEVKEKKLLYYRNPMGLPDTSPVPKKDQMGMDYIAVYEGEDDAPAGEGLKISLDRVQKLGVRTQLAERRALGRVIRASGRVEVNERLLATISPKFEGYVERAAREHDRRTRRDGPAAFRGLQPGARSRPNANT